MPIMIGEHDAQLQEELKARRDQPPQRHKSLDPETARARIDHVNASGARATGVDFERIIGTNDLLQINYLEIGVHAARCVARLYVQKGPGHGDWGTGFLVAPRLLLTNHHVIASPEEALRTHVQFSVEFDVDGAPKAAVTFRCEPQHGFVSDKELDFTLVAVSELSDTGTHTLDAFGFLRLDPKIHKVTEDEFVTIIQHPNGDEKQIALRENRMLKIGHTAGDRKDNLLWYSSDTEPGSSGSPVMNDQWQVLGLHHAAVPELEGTGAEQRIRLADLSWKPLAEVVPGGATLEEWASKDNNGDLLHWIANEGIRVSRLVARITALHGQSGTPASPLVQAFLDDAHGVRPFEGTVPRQSVNAPGMPVILPVPVSTAPAGVVLVQERASAPRRRIRDHGYYDGREGYDPNFLDTPIPLPRLTDRALRFGQPAPVRGAGDGVLCYIHFSVVMNADRRLAFFTAVNIDGARTVKVARGRDEWHYDPRLAIEHQVGDELYSNELGGSGNWFDRGHLVRRQDPIWGERALAALANEDTFHWTNASPQHWEFNQSGQLWQGLENFILFNTDADDLRASVFTGPVFGDSDELHRGIRIPQFFWKVVAVRDRAGRLFSSAYVVSQERYAQDIVFERMPVGPFRSFQVSVAKLEERTGLAFAEAVRAADVFGPERDDKPLRGLADIVHPRR